MKPPLRFRRWAGLTLAILCLVSLPLAADEILNNADFSKGTDNWSGDISGDSHNDNPLQPSTTGQVTLDLRSRRAVRIFQAFNAGSDQVTCTVSFTLSNGGSYTGTAKVSDVASDVNENQYDSSSYNAANNTVTLYQNENYATYSTPFTAPVLILANPDDSKVSLYPLSSAGAVAVVAPNNGLSPGARFPTGVPVSGPAPTPAPIATFDAGSNAFTVQARIKPHRSYRLYLAFPPGTGTVTVTKISVQPAAK